MKHCIINNLLNHFNDFNYIVENNNYKDLICIYNNNNKYNYKIYKFAGDNIYKYTKKQSGYIKQDLYVYDKIIIPLTKDTKWFLENKMNMKIDMTKQQGVLFN
jgi:hypothetical protein